LLSQKRLEQGSWETAQVILYGSCLLVQGLSLILRLYGGGSLMDALLIEYMPILVFLGIAIVLSALFVFAAWLVAKQNPDDEKLSSYECGFEPFSDSRHKFDVRFYLVAILFIIFDLEVAFLFPWAIALGDVGMFGFWSMIIFLAVLTVGFVYEWRKGALEWE